MKSPTMCYRLKSHCAQFQGSFGAIKAASVIKHANFQLENDDFYVKTLLAAQCSDKHKYTAANMIVCWTLARIVIGRQHLMTIYH